MKRLLSFFAVVVLLGAQSLQAQWIQTNDPYGGRVNCFAVNGSNLFAGTYYSGVWRRPLSELVTGIEDDLSQAPVAFALEQNYPNPFNPATTIRYHLPKAAHVALKIYNFSGQEVRMLVNARQPAGMNSVVWDGKDQSGKEVSSGIYLYRLQAGESIQSRELSFER
jgi:hypothetical protein